ncbi:MAG: urea carboxylase-associated family protein [Kiloniellaceae bacterium]
MLKTDILDNPNDNATPCGVNGSLTNTLSPDGTPELGKRYAVPARQGRAVRVAKGQKIRIVNTHGTQVCDTWAFSAANRAEFLSWPHARAWIDRVLPRPGDPLVTNRRRPILTLLEDSSPGVHDTLIAACDLFRYTTLGVKDYHDNCSDNLRLAMMAIGLTVPDVPQPLNLWMNIPVDDAWGIDWKPPVSQPGDHVLLRAEMDCIVAMSACPQDIIPINGEACTPVGLEFVVEG